jgi:hypothetical protein
MKLVANKSRSDRVVASSVVSALCVTLLGCVADDPNTQDRQDIVQAQPRQMVYDCGEDGVITVHAAPSAVRLIEADGESYELPASPPTQNSRYGGSGLALVVEGGEALWMKAGSPPMTCKR